MRALLVLAAILLAAAPAAAERPRTGWSGQTGFSHYFPLSPEGRIRLPAFQQDGRAGIPDAGPAPSCGWAGCRGGPTAAPAPTGGNAAGFRDVCGWAGCR